MTDPLLLLTLVLVGIQIIYVTGFYFGYRQERKRTEKLEKALREAVSDLEGAYTLVEEWSGYASEYFKNKHGLEADLNSLEVKIANFHALLGDASND